MGTFKENRDWSFTSIETFQIPLINLTQPPKFDDYFNVLKYIEVNIDTSLDLVEQDEIAVDTISYYSLDSNEGGNHKNF